MLTHKYAKQKLVSFLLNCVFISVKVVIGHLHMQQIMSTPLGLMLPCMLALIHAIFLISATLLWYLCSTFFWVHCQPSISWDITYQIFVGLLYFYPQLNPILKIWSEYLYLYTCLDWGYGNGQKATKWGHQMSGKRQSLGRGCGL